MIRSEWARRPRVLLVEDEAVIAMDLEEWLAELGFEVIGPFRCSRDALDALDQGPIDFAVLDYILGEENSSSLADRLGRLGVPYAFLTGCQQLLRKAVRAEALMLEKPISRHEMTEALESVEAWWSGTGAQAAARGSGEAARRAG